MPFLVLLLVSSSVSPLRLVLYRPVPFVSLGGPWGGTILAGRPLVVLLISSLLVRRPALLVSSCVLFRSPGSHVPSLSSVSPYPPRWAGRSCVFFVPCRRAFFVVSFSHSLRSSQFIIVSVGVSLRGACGEIELTKTARFNALVVSVPYRVRACVVGDSNRARSNDSEARGTVAGLFGRLGVPYMPAGHSRQSIFTLARPPTWGRGNI